MEEENDHRLPSLRVMVIRFGTSFLTTTLYWNFTFIGVYRQRQSYSQAENSIDLFSLDKSKEDLLSFIVIGGIRQIAWYIYLHWLSAQYYW